MSGLLCVLQAARGTGITKEKIAPLGKPIPPAWVHGRPRPILIRTCLLLRAAHSNLFFSLGALRMLHLFQPLEALVTQPSTATSPDSVPRSVYSL